MEPVTLITEVKPPFSTRLAGEQHQRPPFTQGQMLQGTVSAKGEANLFTLDINGQSVTAESSAPLRVGQQLDLRVVALTPRMELQVVAPNPANRWLGNVLPLLGKESFLLPQLTALADDTRLMAQLGPETRGTVLFYAGRGEAVGTPPTPLPVPTVIGQLADLLVGKTAAASVGLQIPFQEIAEQLQRTSRTASLNPKTAAEAVRLAGLFSPQDEGPDHAALAQAAASHRTAAEPKEAGALLEFMTTLAGFKATETTLLAQLLSLHQAYGSLPSEHPLRQLLAFLIQTTSEHALPSLVQGAGEQVRARLGRLGLNMEHLLAGDKADEAMRTLKFALLELAQQDVLSADKGGAPDQLGQLLELYQLVRLRLANESLVFLPLPFSFLHQGYALVGDDRSDREFEATDEQDGRTNQTVALHLQLEGLGNLQIDIRRQEGRVALRFLAESAEKAKFIAGFRQELEQWLTSGNLESVQFLVGAREPIKVLLEKIMPGGAGMIDIRA